MFFKPSCEGATIPTVYILTHQCMPEVLKIGVTENLEARIKSLDNTRMPLPFECFYAVEIAEAGQAPSLLEIAEILGGQNVTPSAAIVDSLQDKQALESAKKRAQSFNFSMIDVSPGTTLTFKDGPSA